jgi:hypothetical protein
MCQIQQVETPTPAVVISVEVAWVVNATLLDLETSAVALAGPDTECTDPIVPVDTNCTDNNLLFGMPGGNEEYHDECDYTAEHDAIPTGSHGQQPATELARLNLGTIDVDKYGCEDGDDVDADEVEEASEADIGSMQNVDD